MSMQAPPGYTPPGQGSGATGDLVTTLQGVTRQLSTMNANTLTLIAAISARAFGTFTLAAAVSTVVTQTAVKASSVIQLTPTNAAAAALMGSAKALYVSALTPGASFTVSTGNATNAVGTETFQYTIASPV
jgi:hypothetical protein